MQPSTPKSIGKYEVVSLIAQGGMGVVYKAVDRSLERLVAIKMVTGADAEQGDPLKRFFREAQFTANLRHSNIVTIYDLGDFNGTPYLVMEYLPGRSLQSMLDKKSLTMEQKISCVRQVCQGLQYAHSRQPSIVHRDIKPANIMVLDDGTAKIIDFGIARLGQSRNTRTGYVLGSFQYMSPEQIKNQELDGRSDLFSLGVVLYQLLTLRFPFEGETVAETLEKITGSPPPPLKTFIHGYPPQFDSIIARALAKRRDERYQSADEFAFDLLQIESQLKRGLLGDYVEEAEKLFRDGEFERAKQELVRVLEVDGQHPSATDMMKKVQHALNRQQRSRRALNLRVQAEEALKLNRVNEALLSVEQAMRLDPESAELRAFHQRILVKERINQILARAEKACADDDLDAASRAVEEALRIDPDSTRARSFKAIVEARIAKSRSLYSAPRPGAWESERTELDMSYPGPDPVWSDACLDWGKLVSKAVREPVPVPRTPKSSPVSSQGPVPPRASSLKAPTSTPSRREEPASTRPPKVPAVPQAKPPDVPKAVPATPRMRASEVPPSRKTAALSQDFLHTIEIQLGVFIGALAKVVVKKAASQTTDPRRFLELVAGNIKSSDRPAFFAQSMHLVSGGAAEHSGNSRAQAADGESGMMQVDHALAPAEIERAVHLLAQYVGPLAGVLTKKAAPRARSVRELYLLLAEHIEAKAERARFLQEAHIPPGDRR